MKHLPKLSQVVICISLMIGLAGCAHSSKTITNVADSQSNAVSQAACANNAYLQQYGCSLARVEQAAETNEPDAQYALGYMYYNGIGTVKDPETAVVWIKRAAQQGQPLAINALKAIQKAQFPTAGQVNIATQSYPRPKVSAQAPASTSASQATQPAKKKLVVIPHHSKVDQMGALNTMPANHFTVQLFASPHLANVHHLEELLTHKVPMTIASTQRNGATWYLLLAGNFASRKQAQAYVATLPADIQAAKPWIRSFASLQQH